MSKVVSRPRITLPTTLLALCNVALVWALGMQWWQGSMRGSLLMTPAAQLPVPQHPFTLAGQEAAGDLQGRAVFHASRGFYVAPILPAQAQPPPDYRLAGVIRLPNKPVTAILISNQAGGRSKVGIGDQLDGWSIDDIRADRVLVSLNGQRAEIGAKATVISSANATVDIAAPVAAPGMVVMPSGQALQPRAGNAQASGRRVLSAPQSVNSSAAGGDPGSRLYRPPAR